MKDSRRGPGFVALVFLLACLANSRTLPREGYEALNDVRNINRALASTPHFRDTLTWWTGPLAHDGIRDYRPLASYLFWIERKLFGDAYERYLLAGWLLFGTWCALTFVLILRMQIGELFALAGASILLLPWYWNTDPQELDWLAWFPGHPVPLCGLLMIAALLAFDVWLARSRPHWLVGACVGAAGAMLTWGGAITLPGMVALLAWHRSSAPIRRRVAGVIAVGVAVGVVLALRAHFVPGARGPVVNLKLLHKLAIHATGQFTLYLSSGSHWPALLALAIAGWGVLCGRVASLVARFGVLLSLTAVAVTLGGESPMVALVTLLDFNRENAVRTDVIYMTLWVWSTVLLWRRRRELPIVAAYGMVLLSLLPGAQYTGWHYRLIPLAFWALVYALNFQAWWDWLSSSVRLSRRSTRAD